MSFYRRSQSGPSGQLTSSPRRQSLSDKFLTVASAETVRAETGKAAINAPCVARVKIVVYIIIAGIC